MSEKEIVAGYTKMIEIQATVYDVQAKKQALERLTKLLAKRNIPGDATLAQLIRERDLAQDVIDINLPIQRHMDRVFEQKRARAAKGKYMLRFYPNWSKKHSRVTSAVVEMKVLMKHLDERILILAPLPK